MKTYRILLFCTIFSIMSYQSLYSQIRISYIQPDIAAPGMNSYIEFIAPFNSNFEYGNDTTYYFKPSDLLKLEFVNPTDSRKIAFGPLVVSWQGRMLSTQVFVHPWVTPNTWDWSNLSAEFIIPIRLNYNGVQSNIVNLYIVRPFNFGDKRSNPERILGAGALGKRSPRGAMIVDSMLLGSGTYTVSTSDIDPLTPGNQGYLPFILISQGNIIGETTTIISVDGGLSGGQARLQNAGPGGGGGGGRFFDANLACPSSNGDDGGDGYTGGGAGGRNGTAGASNAFKVQGEGTFEDVNLNPQKGYSLNGVPASVTLAYESAAGGTGHPFGSSGLSCGEGNNCEPEGQYGGGSGVKQNTPGGSGGNSTAGQGFFGSGSKAIGNYVVVPLSGGGGAAGGNPRSGLGCNYSGSGGGGGGAILIFAKSMTNVKISAKGSNGQDGVGTSNGGGGAGGSIITASKLFISNGSAQSVFIEGGKAGGGTNQFGGWGRIRRDSPNWNVNVGSASSVVETFSQGPSSDTTKFIKPDKPFRITGTKRSTDSLLLLLKPLSGDWQKIGVIPHGSSMWDIELSLPKTDSVYYFVAMQYLPNPNKISPYYAEPEFIYSQAAANVLIMEKIPEIAGKDTLFIDSVLACDGQVKLFKAKIYNIGDADLILSSSSFKFGYFSLDANINNIIVAPNDSVEITIRYTYNKNHPKSFTDTLFINHNDLWSGKSNPWKIVMNMKSDDFNVITTDKDRQTDILNADYYDCLFEDQKYVYYINNNSEDVINLDKIISTNSNIGINIIGNPIIASGDSCSFEVYFKQAITSNQSTKLYYKFFECNNYLDSLSLGFNIINTELEFVDDGIFPETRVGAFSERTIRVRNIGSANASINSIAQPGNGFTIISTNPSLPCVLLPNETISLLIRFAPTNSGDPIQANLKVISNEGTNACEDEVDLTLQGKAIDSQVLLSKYLMDFGTIYSCQSELDTVFVKNPSNSTAPLVLTQQAEIINSTQFIFIERPPANQIIQPGDSARIIVKFIEGGAGTYYGNLLIHTDDINTPDVYVQLTGTKDALIIDVSQNPINLGDAPVGYQQKRVFRIINHGMLPLDISEIKYDNSYVNGTFYPNVATIPANGGFQDIELTLNVTANLQNEEFFTIQFSQCTWNTRNSVVLNKLIAEPQVSSNLDFGILSGCEDSTRSLIIGNTGNTPYIIKSFQIIGTDAVLFKHAGQSSSFPVSVMPNSTFEFRVTFDPRTSPNGFKQAQLVLESEVNGVDIPITINLTGQKSSAVIATPAEIHFGNFVVGTETQQTLTVSNSGFFAVDIVSINFPTKYAGVFEVSPDHTGANIGVPNGQVVFNVKFTPQDVVLYEDTLYLNIFYNNCSETIPIALSGRGLPARKLSISLPNLTLVDPRFVDYQIPIYAKVETDTLVNYYIDTLEVSFNRSLFYPRSITNGRILYNNLNGETRTIGLELSGINLPNVDVNTIISQIRGDVMLGNVTSTPLAISKLIYSEPLRVGEMLYESGSLSIEVCPDGGDRLLDVTSQPVTIIQTPTPAFERLNLDIELTEIGTYNLEIYDIRGNRIDVLDNWTISLGEDRKRSLSVDVSNYSGGVYLLKLTTPSTYYSKILAISK